MNHTSYVFHIPFLPLPLPLPGPSHLTLQEEGGDCIDQVVRGCFNNGTCVAPDVCVCAEVGTVTDKRVLRVHHPLLLMCTLA